MKIAISKADREKALEECNFFLHGSGPGLVGAKETELARKIGKPYGLGGVTLKDEELMTKRELLAGAKFVFLRDTDSLKALQESGVAGPRMDFEPDATFAIDLRDDEAAAALMKEHRLEQGKFLKIED